jgi:hypothetical protein
LVSLGLGVADADGVTLDVGLVLAVGVGVGVVVSVGVGVAVGVEVGVAVGLVLGVGVGVEVTLVLGVGEGVAVGEQLAFGDVFLPLPGNSGGARKPPDVPWGLLPGKTLPGDSAWPPPRTPPPPPLEPAEPYPVAPPATELPGDGALVCISLLIANAPDPRITTKAAIAATGRNHDC